MSDYLVHASSKQCVACGGIDVAAAKPGDKVCTCSLISRAMAAADLDAEAPQHTAWYGLGVAVSIRDWHALFGHQLDVRVEGSVEGDQFVFRFTAPYPFAIGDHPALQVEQGAVHSHERLHKVLGLSAYPPVVVRRIPAEPEEAFRAVLDDLYERRKARGLAE